MLNELLARRGVSAPFLQSALLYAALLALWALPAAWGSPQPRRRRDWLWFALLGAMEAGANGLAVLAYSYTTVASVLVILCLSTPVAMSIGACALRQRFGWQQVAAALLSVLSAAAFTLVDAFLSGPGEVGAPDARGLLGDAMALGSALLYGGDSLLNEKLSQRYGNVRLQARMAPSALLLSAALFLGLELRPLLSGALLLRPADWGLVAGFVAVMLAFYACSPVVFYLGGATAFNLGLLSCNVYGLLASALIFGRRYSLWIILPTVALLAGLAWYFAAGEVRARRERRAAERSGKGPEEAAAGAAGGGAEEMRAL